MILSLKNAMAIMAIATGLPALGAEGIVVEHLGTNNTLVRVDGDTANFILLPVQEAIDDATVNVVVDGKLDKTFYVRLAKTKVDYEVPFDLSQYKGHDVVFNIITSQNRANVREAKDDACWGNFKLADTLIQTRFPSHPSIRMDERSQRNVL